MAVKVHINGELFDEETARIPVFDRGFLYGDSVYEVMRTSGGRPVDLEAHLHRLARSAAALALDLPGEDELRDAVGQTLAAVDHGESYVRVIVTRGRGEIGLDPALAIDPLTIVIVRPLRLPTPEMYADGVRMEIVGVQRTSRRAIDPAVKSGNYLNSILALHEARRAGAYEALMCDAAGRVAEGTSNVFVVRGGEVTTPALEVGILGGITRQRVMELAQSAGIAAAEGVLFPVDVRAAEEVFITSSIRAVLPVTQLDGRPVGLGRPGPVTRRIQALYDEYLAGVAVHAQ